MARSERREQLDDSKLAGIVAALRRYIARKRLAPGDRLPAERELASELTISRGDVRRGLGYLAATGLLEIRHGSGAYLSEGPGLPRLQDTLHADAAHMFEARLVIETELVALAAERRTDSHLVALSDEVGGMESSIDLPGAFLIHDIRFHRAIAAASGNPVLASLMEAIAGATYEERRRSVGTAENRTQALAFHKKIYGEVRRGRVAAARQAMLQHLSEARDESMRAPLERLAPQRAAGRPSAINPSQKKTAPRRSPRPAQPIER